MPLKSISPEDKLLFRESIKNLKSNLNLKKNHSPVINNSPQNYYLSDPIMLDAENFDPNKFLYFAKTGLQHKLLNQFKQGKLNINAIIDLHHLTVPEARENISEFISNACAKKYRCIQIIHGKGKILKYHVEHWLKQIDDILAFSSCIPQHGGTGAVYVLLKI